MALVELFLAKRLRAFSPSPALKIRLQSCWRVFKALFYIIEWRQTNDLKLSIYSYPYVIYTIIVKPKTRFQSIKF